MSENEGFQVSPKTLFLAAAIFVGSTVGGGGASAIMSPQSAIREQTEKLTRIDVKLDMALQTTQDHENRMRTVEYKVGLCESKLKSLMKAGRD